MLFFVIIAFFTVYMLTSQSSGSGYHVVPWHQSPTPKVTEHTKSDAEKERERKKEQYEKHEQEMRNEFAAEYEAGKK